MDMLWNQVLGVGLLCKKGRLSIPWFEAAFKVGDSANN